MAPNDTSSRYGLLFSSALLGCLLISVTTFAQLKVEPVQRKNPVHRPSQHPAARTQSIPPLSLPFWDDFSFTPVDDPTDSLSNYPLDSIWTNSNSVWISRGIGLLSPTLNVATFDGLDSVGLPYSDVTLANGFRDSLTSRPIKMKDVLPADRNTVFLSFLYQWQGNGEAPDENDFLRLSFKDSLGIWQSVMEIRTKASFNRKEFYDTIIQVNDGKYFHNNFQFRFENYGRKSGPFDTWNIDYVYLNQGRTLSSDSYPDRALASEATKLFGTYYAVPKDHFFIGEPIDTVEFDVKNMKNSVTGAIVAVGYDVVAHYRNYTNGSVTTFSELLVDYAPVGVGILAPQQRVHEKMKGVINTFTPPRFDPTADSIDVTLDIILISGDENDADPIFSPIDFHINDTLRTTYHLEDYYAYDDGTAEYSALLSTSSDTLAYAFDMVNDAYDTLVGFDIYYAPYSLSANKLVDFFIYEDNNGVPGERIYSRLSYTVQRKGVNVFQRIGLEPVRVKDRFYIGYRGTDVKIGLDYSNDTGSKIFNNTNGTWTANNAVHGSLMIRPIIGKGDGSGPIGGVEEDRRLFTVYPNPSDGTFRVDRRVKVLNAFSLTGQLISFDRELNGDEQVIKLHHASPGLYLLRMQYNNSVRVEKVMVR